MEHARGASYFPSRPDVVLEPVANEETALAEAIVARKARAVIIGVAHYRGPLYEALARTSAGAGAIISRFGVGHDGIDKALARQHGIVVTNTPGVLDQSVAEYAIWLLGTLARHVSVSEGALRAGQFAGPEGIELAGKTLGIVGCGAIGRRVARIAHYGLSMRVLAADTRPADELACQYRRPLQEVLDDFGLAMYTDDVAAVLAESDAVSLHVPACAQTRHVMNADRLAEMKPGALLLNTARGLVVDESAVYDAILSGRLGGAALDVFENEPYRPLVPEKDLRTLPNVVLTPHIGSNTREATRRMAEASFENVVQFFAGRMDRLTRVDG
jgi:lactate dehydrogenase-like 2-hydroxyacid dehydrogenase